MAPSTQIELNTDYQSAERFPAWIALFTFSTVCLAAAAAQETYRRTSADKWALSVTSISMVLSLVSVGLYLMARSLWVGTKFEGGMVRTSYL
jgi:hypothetical protein